ncbi:hypothetical protein [Acidithiobacillus sp.]|uniref:hypothetical protein n=1 Tax=Acidithiobacillus sp. TaxID=1872118 RepID=UPI0025BE2209|nr:hypothetical protein [Acidithiobacillus sp.]
MSTEHGWSSRFGFARWVAVNVAMPVFIVWILLDVFVRGNSVSLLYVILGFTAAGMAVVAIDSLARKGKIDQGKVDAGWERPDRLCSPWRFASKIYNAHTRTFPWQVRQKGSIGREITDRRRGQGRQGGHKRRWGGNPAKKASSDDGPGEPGEPPYQLLTCAADQHQQSFFSFQSAARILDCSPKTLRNKVSAGKIPAPVQTSVGPRFTAEILQAIISPPIPVVAPPARPRGRPRIAQPKLVTPAHGGDQ